MEEQSGSLYMYVPVSVNMDNGRRYSHATASTDGIDSNMVMEELGRNWPGQGLARAGLCEALNRQAWIKSEFARTHIRACSGAGRVCALNPFFEMLLASTARKVTVSWV